MIVDDSPFIHKAIQKALNATDLYEVCGIAKNGKEGSELYDTLLPDIVFMDITMPVMDGLDATKAIISKHPDAKIIMLSAMGDDDLIAKAKAIGVTHFAQKPFKAEEMLAIINNI
jgi:two-component system chemotaxis response regulator CheY